MLDRSGFIQQQLRILQSETGEQANAEVLFREAIRLQERLLKFEPGKPELLRNLAASVERYTFAVALPSSRAAQAELYAKALAYQTKAAKLPGLTSGNIGATVAVTYNNLGACAVAATPIGGGRCVLCPGGRHPTGVGPCSPGAELLSIRPGGQLQ